MTQWQKVPILILGFNRPKNLESLLSQSALQYFENVIVSIDGPRVGNTRDQLANEAIKRIVAKTNFESRFSTTNLGSRAIPLAITTVLQDYPNVIVVEDDLLFSDNSLRCIAEKILEIEPGIVTVGGYSPQLFVNNVLAGNSWRSSNYFCPWVWGTSQEMWARYKQDISSQDLAQLVHSKTWNALSPATQAKWFLRFIWCVNNPNLTWDYQMQFMHFREGLKNLRPWKSLVINQGFNPEGQRTHHAPIWNAKYCVNSVSNKRKLKFESYSNLIDSLTFAADHKILDSKFHNFLRKLYK